MFIVLERKVRDFHNGSIPESLDNVSLAAWCAWLAGCIKLRGEASGVDGCTCGHLPVSDSIPNRSIDSEYVVRINRTCIHFVGSCVREVTTAGCERTRGIVIRGPFVLRMVSFRVFELCAKRVCWLVPLSAAQYPQFGLTTRVSSPAAFVTCEEKTPATAKTTRLSKAKNARGSERRKGLFANFHQYHISCVNCTEAPPGELVFRKMFCC